MSAASDANKVIAEVKLWLNDVVIGLNLCPFSAKPTRENRVRFVVSSALDDEEILNCLQAEMELLQEKPASEIETTLVIVPNHLQDFFDYNLFLQWANKLLKRNGWTGVFQLASFHPHYCFAGAEPEDAENLTNRSPYPLVHIIREASLEQALNFYPDVEQIPEVNQQKMKCLTSAEKRSLFAYCFDG